MEKEDLLALQLKNTKKRSRNFTKADYTVMVK